MRSVETPNPLREPVSDVVKYAGANRWSDLTSALLPTFASSMAWFALGITTSV
jgi:hypothetical protein